MPEFEETDSQPNPDHSYTPSSDAQNSNTQKNTGGRRRSGGFKSDAVPSNSQIGEVDPSEVLQVEAVKSQPIPKDSVEAPKAGSNDATTEPVEKSSGAPRRSGTPKQPQPSEATLQSIQVVEGRIAKRKTEIEKKRPAGDATKGRKTKKRGPRSPKSSQPTGLFAGVFGFLGKLFGKDSKSPASATQGPPSGKKYSKHNKQRHRNGAGKPYSGSKKPRGGRGRRPNNANSRNERSSY